MRIDLAPIVAICLHLQALCTAIARYCDATSENREIVRKLRNWSARRNIITHRSGQIIFLRFGSAGRNSVTVVTLLRLIAIGGNIVTSTSLQMLDAAEVQEVTEITTLNNSI